MLFSHIFKTTASKVTNTIFEGYKKFISHIYNIGCMKKEVEIQQNLVNDEEFNLLLHHSKDYYISLHRLLELIEGSKLELKDILESVVHKNEIHPSDSSVVVETYAVPMNDGILLTPNKPENFEGSKVRIISIRQSSDTK